MKSSKHIYLLILSSLCFSICFAQPDIYDPSGYKDGVYDKENAVNRRYIPYTHLREGDVTWQKRVWRSIDMREKINQPLYYPVDVVKSRVSLMQVVTKAILNGQLAAFVDEEFETPYAKAEIRAKLVIVGDSVEQEQFDKDGNSYTIKVPGVVDSTWAYENFCSLDLKEDWFFDKQKSSLEVRIIGLGFGVKLKGKEDLGCNPFFYVYFPACRPYFAKEEVFNPKNDSERRTYEDVFWKRQFSSTITQESNTYNRSIDKYSQGIDALLESDRIKGDIFRWEHDLWHF